MDLGKLRANVTSRQVSPPAGRRAVAGTTPLMEVGVTGQNARVTARAANLLAQEVVATVSPYVEDKIEALEEGIAADERELAESERRLDSAQAELARLQGDSSLAATDRLIGVTTLNATIGSLVERRGLVTQNLLEGRQAVARRERRAAERRPGGGVAEDNRAQRRALARRRRPDRLILGLLAAILWEPAERRFR